MSVSDRGSRFGILTLGAVIAVGTVVTAGCAATLAKARKDPLSARIEAADVLWAARSGPGGFDRAMSAAVALLAGAPTDPRVLFRLSRAQWVAGRIAPEDPLPHYEAGRAYGFRCLLANPAFAEAAHRAGDRVDTASAAALTAVDAPCVAWTVANSLAVVSARGPGASLRLEDAGHLLHADAVRGTPGTDGMLDWDAAQLILLDPSVFDREAARSALRAAIAAAPTNGVFRAELSTTFPDAADAAWEGWIEGEYRLEERGSTPPAVVP